MTEEDLSPEEKEKIDEILRSYGSPIPDEKHSIHTFLNKVATSSDTIKTGNLTSDEVGLAELPIRSYKEFELLAGELCEDDILSSIFKKNAEILTSTSLSKDAKLITLAVIQKREMRDLTPPPRAENKGWFKPKQKLDQYQM